MRFRTLVAPLVLLLWLATPWAATAADLAVVLSSNAKVYAEFGAALQKALEGSHWRVVWNDAVTAPESLPRADLIVSVGTEASRAALKQSHPPVLAVLLPKQAYERIVAESGSGRRSSAIFLDQPLPRLFALARQLLPDKKRAGVLLGSETRTLLQALRHSAAAGGFQLEVEEVDGDASPVMAANHLLPRSDFLIALPDSQLYRRENVRAILLTTYRYRRPVIGFSQALATAGALAAVYSTPTHIAHQTAEVLRTLPAEGGVLPPPQAPAYFSVTVNEHVAEALGLDFPEGGNLRRALPGERER